MNETALLIVKILLLCSACAIVAAVVIFVLKEWLGWLLTSVKLSDKAGFIDYACRRQMLHWSWP
jgi:hypothetical protein